MPIAAAVSVDHGSAQVGEGLVRVPQPPLVHGHEGVLDHGLGRGQVPQQHHGQAHQRDVML
jgi:hypothetical protein